MSRKSIRKRKLKLQSISEMYKKQYSFYWNLISEKNITNEFCFRHIESVIPSIVILL